MGQGVSSLMQYRLEDPCTAKAQQLASDEQLSHINARPGSSPTTRPVVAPQSLLTASAAGADDDYYVGQVAVAVVDCAPSGLDGRDDGGGSRGGLGMHMPSVSRLGFGQRR